MIPADKNIPLAGGYTIIRRKAGLDARIYVVDERCGSLASGPVTSFLLDYQKFILADVDVSARVEFQSEMSRKVEDAIERIWDLWFTPDRWEALGELISW